MKLKIIIAFSLLLIPKSFSAPPEINVTRWKASTWSHLHDGNDWDWRTNYSSLTLDQFSIQNGGSTVIASNHIRSLEVTCTATHPIEWELERSDGNVHITSTTRRDFSNPDISIAVLEIDGDASPSSPTGNYTCVNLGHPGKEERSVFIFWEGTSPPYLALSGTSVSAFLEDDNRTMHFPCYTNRPDVNVSLFLEVNCEFLGEMTFHPIPTDGDHVTFNPQKGFLVHVEEAKNPGHSRYKCTTEEEGDEVRVNPEKGPRSSKFIPELMTPGTSLTYDPETELYGRIVCCAKRGSSPPKLHSIPCETPRSCRIHRLKLLKKLGKNGKDISSNGSCSSVVPMSDYGVLRCQGEGIDIIRTFYKEFNTTPGQLRGLYFSYSELVPQNMMNVIFNHWTPPFYHKETVPLVCEGAKSYFDDGHHWAVKWRNGTLTALEVNHDSDSSSPWEHRFDASVSLDADMAEIVCFLPVWNSSAWVNGSVKLDIQDSSVPSISGPEVETLKLHLKETSGRWIECRCSGTPAPSINWEKNGEDVTFQTSHAIRHDYNVSSLHFLQVTNETQGEYRCVARNVRGEAFKTFQVVVVEEEGKEKGHAIAQVRSPRVSSSSAWGTIFLVALLLASFFAIGALVWKLRTQRRMVNHLTTIVFRPVEEDQEVLTE